MPILSTLKPEASPKKRLWRMSFRLLAIASLLIALAHPQTYKTEKGHKEGQLGIDAVFCIDVSQSMRAHDVPPNRLLFAKQIVDQSIQRLGGSRIGLVVFAGGAYIRMPLTADHPAARSLLGDISYDLLSNQGTNLAQAIQMAERTLGTDKEPQGRAIILLTDGENHDGTPLEEAKRVSSNKTKVYTIAIGTTQGATIPTPQGTPLTDENGNIVISKSNPQLCQEIAQAGKGESFSGSSAEQISAQLEKAFAQLPQANMWDQEESRTPLAGYAVAMGLLFLSIAHLISVRKSRLFKKLNLFERS